MGVAANVAQLHDVAASLTLHRPGAADSSTAVAAQPPVAAAATEESGGESGDESGESGCGALDGDDADWSDGGGAGGSSGDEAGSDSDREQGAEVPAREGEGAAERAGSSGANATRRSARAEPQSVAGFFDARAAAQPRLSLFGVAWRLLSGWVSPQTVLHLHGRPVPPAALPDATVLVRAALMHVLPDATVLVRAAPMHVRAAVCLVAVRGASLLAACVACIVQPVVQRSGCARCLLCQVPRGKAARPRAAAAARAGRRSHGRRSSSAVRVQAQRALRSMLLARVAPVMARLQVTLPRPLVVGALHDLVTTLDTSTSVPTMAESLLDTLVLVLMAALSKHCVASLQTSLRPDSEPLQGLLHELALSPELFACLLGRLLDEPSA